MNKLHVSLQSGHIPSPQPKLQASQIKPYDLAIALTLMEGDRYRVLGPPDYLAFLMKHPGHHLVEDVYSTNNKIILWVKCSILHYEKADKRAEVFKFFINAAEVSETFPLVVFYLDDYAISRNVEKFATFRPLPQYLLHYTALRLAVCDSQHRPCPVPCKESLDLLRSSSILRQAIVRIDWLSQNKVALGSRLLRSRGWVRILVLSIGIEIH
jgi:hypothetical protein